MSGLYGRAAQLRRAWYEKRPAARRRLDRPVISIGNVASGGSGKTPLVASLALMLRDQGERPVVLSRGYGRREQADGVLVVSDGAQVLEPVERSGDEPQMLARALPGVPVLVSSDRYLAGRLGEQRFGGTVHILDDGFQHLQLARDLDLVLIAPDDLHDTLLPGGRLREPLSAARAADAVIVTGSGDEAAVARHIPHDLVFRAVTHVAPLRPIDPETVLPSPIRRAVAVAGIARPRRFFEAVRSQGLDVVREVSFRDHHWYSAKDLDQIERAAADAQADIIVTTEKDAVRLGTAGRSGRWCVLPVRISVEPADRFSTWIAERLRAARAA